jgi:hypothetical protein
MSEVEIRIFPEQTPTGSFRLLELPPLEDLSKSIESSADDVRYYALTIRHGPCRTMLLDYFDICPSLIIKDGPEDDADYASRTRHITSARRRSQTPFSWCLLRLVHIKWKREPSSYAR